MLKKIVLTLVFMIGCTTQSPETKIEKNEIDSLLIKSKETIVTTNSVSKRSDSVINKKVNNVVSEIKSIKQINSLLKEENSSLSKAISLKTEKIIRDTIYITEKKNFWGKTKKTLDSSQSVQIDTLEDKN
jgi:hypothetical protein